MRRARTAAAIALIAAASIAGTGCGSSSDGASATTSTATPATTTSATPTTPTTATGADGTTTSEPASGALPSCQDLVQQYTDTFTPDDLAPLVELFRSWAPSMPDDVGAAVLRIADAYEQAKTLGDLDMTDQGLGEDAQTFSTWTSDGCPAG